MMSDRKAETPRLAPRADAVLLGQERARREVVELLAREIMPNRRQPRQRFDEGSLAELAESIRLHGVLEPVIVRAIPLTLFEGSGRQYELIAGERRWRAVLLAGLAAVPALVLPETTSDQTALELAITENLQREDLHPLDEAAAFGRMQAELGYSYAQIAERLGTSRGYVQNRLRLLQLDDDLRALVRARPDTLSHVYELAKLADPAQRQPLIDAVQAEDLSLADTRAGVQSLLNPSTQISPSPAGAQLDEPPFTLGQSPPPEPDLPQPEEAPATPRAAAPVATTRGGLTSRDRASLVATIARLAQLRADPSRLEADDWKLLEALAERLVALLEHREA